MARFFTRKSDGVVVQGELFTQYTIVKTEYGHEGLPKGFWRLTEPTGYEYYVSNGTLQRDYDEEDVI